MPKRYWLIFGTFLLSMLLYVDRICISSAKEAITTDLELSDTQFGWVLSAFALGYALCQTPSGLLADRFGPRIVLTSVVSFWSFFTGLTAMARGFASLLVYRFLFGAGEAGAFPSCARAFYSWLPMSERGIAQGINFSGSRLGAAFALPVVAAMVTALGWRVAFLILAGVGFFWAAFWYVWFKDDPVDHTRISETELERILKERQQPEECAPQKPQLTTRTLFGSRNMWLAMVQYFCSNFTFFFCLTWLFPHLKATYNLEAVETGLYASAPLLAGALGNWFSGGLVDGMYRRGRWRGSRQWPAIIGFALAAIGLIGSVYMDTALGAVFFLSIAIFGADMTLPPSWSFCIDIGRRNAGAVSGTMNMAGNIGSFVTGLAFPYLHVWTGSTSPFFFVGAALNGLAIVIWMLTRPDRPLEEF
jgi:ACS family glucarate transporter-like MFS transporter